MTGPGDSLLSRWGTFKNLPQHSELSIFPDREPRIRHQDVLDDLKFRCPDCTYDLTGCSGAYCPDCGIELAYEPVPIFTACDWTLIWAAAMVLDQQQVTNMTKRGTESLFTPNLQSAGQLPRVLVPFKFVHEAAEILRDRFGQLTFRQGEKPPPEPAGDDWICPYCGESNPAAFEICWSCRQAVGGPTSENQPANG